MKKTLLAAIAALTLVAPVAVSAQEVPSYAQPEQREETIHGRVTNFDGGYQLAIDDANGYVDNVRLHDGTVINPTGIALAPGMVVNVIGENAGPVFEANEIDTPYTIDAGIPIYAGHPWYYYGPTVELSFFFGDVGWWHGGGYPVYSEGRGYYGGGRDVGYYPGGRYGRSYGNTNYGNGYNNGYGNGHNGSGYNNGSGSTGGNTGGRAPYTGNSNFGTTHNNTTTTNTPSSREPIGGNIFGQEPSTSTGTPTTTGNPGFGGHAGSPFTPRTQPDPFGAGTTSSTAPTTTTSPVNGGGFSGFGTHNGTTSTGASNSSFRSFGSTPRYGGNTYSGSSFGTHNGGTFGGTTRATFGGTSRSSFGGGASRSSFGGSSSRSSFGGGGSRSSFGGGSRSSSSGSRSSSGGSHRR